MYYLSVLLDNRKYQVVKLQPAHIDTAGTLTPSVVIERETGTNKPLWGIAHEAVLVHHGGFEADRKIDWATAAIESSGQTLRILLNEQIADAVTLPTPATVADFGTDNEAQRWQCVAQHTYTAHELMLVIEATIGGQLFVGKVQLHLIPQHQIYDVVIDFGSEASQVVYHRRQKSTNFRRMELVGNLLDYYYGHLKGQGLHQQTDDKELYRSAFFIKKEGSVFDPTDPPGKQGDKELLNLLTARANTDTLSEQNMLVSNLKLAHLGAYNFTIKFQDSQSNAFGVLQQNFSNAAVRLQQAVINYFLQTVLEEIRRSTRENRPIYLAVRLLVPNVFEQNKLAKIIYGTQQGLEQIAAKNPTFQLKGVEVSTLSESDASFLGYKREKDQEAKYSQSYFEAGKRYLVIDVGKGTTDFSILQIHAETKQLASLYRSGFIGAGNVLSYAFVDTVLTALVGKNTEKRQRVLFNIVKRSDVSTKMRFMEVIEQFKINYNPQGKYRKIEDFISDRETLVRQISNPKEDALDAITQLLETIHQQQNSIQDEFGIVIDTVNDLASRIHRQVSQSGAFRDAETQEVKVAKLILTGRGFKFEPLTKAIKQIFGIRAETAEELKKICLQGAFSSEAINYESNLVGYPEVYQLFGTVGQQSKQIDKGNGVVINVPIYQRLKGMLDTLNQRLDLFGDDHIISKITVQDKPTTMELLPVVKTEEEDFLLRGKSFYQYTKAEKVVSICGLDYRRHNAEGQTVNVFYTGEDFLIRGAKTASLLQIPSEFFKTNHLVVQTLFPFVELSQSSEIPVQSLEADGAI